MSRLCGLLLIPLLLDPGSAIHFYLPATAVKCLQQDILKDVLVTGEYEVSQRPETTTNLRITDSSGYMLYAKDDVTKGKFSFITEEQDQFNVCFYSTSPRGSRGVPDKLVQLNMKHGVEAKSYKEIDEVEKLTPLEVRLRHIERLSQFVADSFTRLEKRGTDMQHTNASTNTRVLFLSIISMSWLSALAVWQVFYLKRFFRRKKLIE